MIKKGKFSGKACREGRTLIYAHSAAPPGAQKRPTAAGKSHCPRHNAFQPAIGRVILQQRRCHELKIARAWVRGSFLLGASNYGVLYEVHAIHSGGSVTRGRDSDRGRLSEPGAVQRCTQGSNDKRRSGLHVRGYANGGEVVAKGFALLDGAGMSGAHTLIRRCASGTG